MPHNSALCFNRILKSIGRARYRTEEPSVASSRSLVAGAQPWQPLQSTEGERKMDPQVVAAHGDDVVVLWHQRGRSGDGDSIDEEVLGLYRFREGKLARAQMFYFDTVRVASFLARAEH
jgi:hypothetical protein